MDSKANRPITAYPEHVQKAIQAANRSAEKLRAQKKALGQKLVIWENGKVLTVDP